MGLNLSKNDSINLSKASSTELTRIRAELGWEKSADVKTKFDIDVTAFLLQEATDAQKAGKKPEEIHNMLPDSRYVICYTQMDGPDGCAKHSPDNEDGSGEEEVKEWITVDIPAMPPTIREVSYVVTIHHAAVRRQHFGLIKNAFIRLLDDETGQVLARFNLTDEFTGMTAVQIGSLYQHEDLDWSFKAISQGYKRKLGDFVRIYGVDVEKE